jgi:hypothetical protein
LAADLDRQPVIDFCVSRHGSFGLVGGIDEDRVATSFTFETATVALKVVD